MSHQVAFITTVHDPERRLLRALRDAAEVLRAYTATYAFVTEPTDLQVIDALRAADVEVAVGAAGCSGVGQRHVLRSALQAGHEDMFYCDFDRWLHWAGSYPEELSSLPDRMRQEHKEAWFICLGRSERAVATHPIAQTLPEAITNRALSTVAGRRLDATAGAAWIRWEGAKLILDGSTANTKATDLEWPGLVLRSGRSRVQGAFFEGLEFETADRYREEIARIGSMEDWLRLTYDRPEALHERLQLAADSIAALMQVTGNDDLCG